MVQALIPRVLLGQEGLREIRGATFYGHVAATRLFQPTGGRRSYYADVVVLGAGGRRHTFENCICLIPVRPDDAVVVQMPFGDASGQGCLLIGRQTPARPFVYQSPAGAQATMINALEYELANFPYPYLQWNQSYVFAVSSDVGFTYLGGTPPALETLDLTVTLIDPGNPLASRLPQQVLASLAEVSGGQGRFTWSGQLHIDDYLLPGVPVDGSDGLAIQILVEADSAQTNAPARIAVNDFVVRVTELGSGTY